jgi:hypothetical protein
MPLSVPMKAEEQTMTDQSTMKIMVSSYAAFGAVIISKGVLYGFSPFVDQILQLLLVINYITFIHPCDSLNILQT